MQTKETAKKMNVDGKNVTITQTWIKGYKSTSARFNLYIDNKLYIYQSKNKPTKHQINKLVSGIFNNN